MKLPKHLVDVLILGALALATIRAVSARVPRIMRLSDQQWHAISASTDFMPPKPGDHILVEFMDYQCPSCARMEREALSGKLLDSLGVRRIIRHFPLPYHAQALTAAASTECVRRQTGTTATVHALLLQQQDSLGKVPWTTFALNSGAHDTSAFNRCIEDTAVALQIQRDIALGKDVGLSGTPAFYLDGVQVPALLPSQFAAYLSSPKTRLGLGDVGTAIKSFF